MTDDEDVAARLRTWVYGPAKCPDCCNVRSHETGEVENFYLAESRCFLPYDPEEGCHSEGQCDWNRHIWSMSGDERELVLTAAREIERLRRGL